MKQEYTSTNVDEAMVESYQIKKQIKRLTHKPQLSNFYNPSVGQKNSELLQWLQTYSL